MTGVLKINKDNFKDTLEKIARGIKQGKVLICPTDTVYGFICDATNKKAVSRIFKIKNRPKSKPISVFVRDLKTAKEITIIDEGQEKILKKYWPGATTAILERKPTKKIYGAARNTIGLRVPKYKLLQEVMEKVNRPLSQTSVNISGKPFLSNVQDMVQWFETQKQKPDLIIDAGVLKKGKPSRVIDLTGPKIKIFRK